MRPGLRIEEGYCLVSCAFLDFCLDLTFQMEEFMTLDVPGLRYREKLGQVLGSTFMWNGGLYIVTGILYAYDGSNYVPAQVFNQGPASLPKGTITAQLPLPYEYYSLCVDDDFPHLKSKSGKFKDGGPFTRIRIDPSGYSKLQGVGQYKSYGLTSIAGMGYVPTMYVGGYIPASLQAGNWDGVSFNYADRAKLLGSNFLVPNISHTWGPEAWAKSAPKIQMADGFVFLSESRELPSMLMDQARRFHKEWNFLARKGGLPWKPGHSESTLWRMQPKQVADEYLTQQFGWAPFLGDLNKFFKAYLNSGDYMRRMAHDNDQFRHVRRVLLDDIQVTNQVSGDYTWNLLPNNNWDQYTQIRPGAIPTYDYHEEKLQLVTTSGAFKWYKPEFDMIEGHHVDDSKISALYRHMAMYGARINPSNIWRATPWTWLIDWGLSVGRNIDALTAYVEDGVVCKYLFLMHHTVKRQVLNIRLPVERGDVTLSFVNVVDVKLRRGVDSPFGFGSPWETLSPWRLTILGALGISKPTRVGYH